MSINEEEAMKSFFKTIDFEKMDRNAKIKAKASIVITLPLTLLSLCFIFMDWGENTPFLNNVYRGMFWIPTWFSLICSILGYIFKNGLALERMALVPKGEIYIIVSFLTYTIVKLDVFQMTEYQENLTFTIISLIAALISFIYIIVLLISAFYYEKNKISTKDNIIQYFKKQGMSEQEIHELLNIKN